MGRHRRLADEILTTIDRHDLPFRVIVALKGAASLMGDCDDHSRKLREIDANVDDLPAEVKALLRESADVLGV